MEKHHMHHAALKRLIERHVCCQHICTHQSNHMAWLFKHNVWVAKLPELKTLADLKPLLISKACGRLQTLVPRTQVLKWQCY